MLFYLGKLLAAAVQNCDPSSQCLVRIGGMSGDTQKNVSVCFKSTPNDDCSCTCSGLYFYTPDQYLQCETQCPETRPFMD